VSKTFPSSASFRQSLESRLQTISKETGIDLQRVRRKVAFERFLARLFATQPYPWVLKGGYALEVRFETSRATKDLDLGTRLKVIGTDEEQLVPKSQKFFVLLDSSFPPKTCARIRQLLQVVFILRTRFMRKNLSTINSKNFWDFGTSLYFSPASKEKLCSLFFEAPKRSQREGLKKPFRESYLEALLGCIGTQMQKIFLEMVRNAG